MNSVMRCGRCGFDAFCHTCSTHHPLAIEMKKLEEQLATAESENARLRGALEEISKHQADSELDGRLVFIAKSALGEEK